MTQSKHFKALIRARMAKTGESYSISRSHLLGTLKSIKPELVAEFKAHDKHVAATASSDKTVRLWDLPNRTESATVSNHSKPVVAVDLSADGNLAATGSYDGTVRLWSLGDQAASSRIKVGERVGSVAFHPLTSWLAVSGATSQVGVYDSDGTEVAQLSASTTVTAVGWTGDGEFLIGVGGNAIRLWSHGDRDEVRSIDVDTTWVSPFAVNDDSSLLAVGWEHHVAIWRVDEDKPAAVIDGLPKGVYNLDFPGDGRLLALGCADGRVRVWAV